MKTDPYRMNTDPKGWSKWSDRDDYCGSDPLKKWSESMQIRIRNMDMI